MSDVRNRNLAVYAYHFPRYFVVITDKRAKGLADMLLDYSVVSIDKNTPAMLIGRIRRFPSC